MCETGGERSESWSVHLLLAGVDQRRKASVVVDGDADGRHLDEQKGWKNTGSDDGLVHHLPEWRSSTLMGPEVGRMCVSEVSVSHRLSLLGRQDH